MQWSRLALGEVFGPGAQAARDLEVDVRGLLRLHHEHGRGPV